MRCRVPGVSGARRWATQRAWLGGRIGEGVGGRMGGRLAGSVAGRLGRRRPDFQVTADGVCVIMRLLEKMSVSCFPGSARLGYGDSVFSARA